jgi:excisionase family DNA binding protein
MDDWFCRTCCSRDRTPYLFPTDPDTCCASCRNPVFTEDVECCSVHAALQGNDLALALPASSEKAPDALRELQGELIQLRLDVRADLAELKMRMVNPLPVSVSVEEAAARLGCGRTKVFELLRRGKLRRGKAAGRALRITVASIDAFLSGPKRQDTPRRTRRYVGDIGAAIRALPIGATRQALIDQQERASRGQGGAGEGGQLQSTGGMGLEGVDPGRPVRRAPGRPTQPAGRTGAPAPPEPDRSGGRA